MNDTPWPTIPVVAPRLTPSDFVSGVLELTNENVDELLAFYDVHMLPQLACRTDGAWPAKPERSWLMAEGRTVIVVREEASNVIRGAWAIKDNGILYPCATVDDISGIFRMLWDETITHFDYLWGSTDNPVILQFARAAVRKARTPGRPTVTDSKIEWRRPT